MREQEFRARLKRAAGNDGLSTERRMQVLARAGKEDKTVWMSGKMKLILVMIVVLMLGVTGALASSWGMVDWQGEPFSNRVSSDQRMMDLMGGRKNGKVKSVLKWKEDVRAYTGSTDLGMDYYASTLEKLQAWITADGTLPWPVNIPKGYDQMSMGRVHVVSGPEGEFQLLEQEITEDGYIITYFYMPEDHLLLDSYSLYLTDHKRHQLQINVSLVGMNWKRGFPMEEGSVFTELNVDGMVEAIAIETATETRLALRQELWPSVTYKTVEGHPEGVIRESLSEYDCIEIEIIGQGAPDDLLAIFGLTAK